MVDSNIVTGVDKLVQIIDNAGGKIKLKDAMTQMNVSKELIEDWANTLEASKAISIEYKLFGGTWLVKGVSKAELVKKAKEITLKEEAFKEKVLVTIKNFETDSKGLDELGVEFDKLSKELSDKGKHIQDQLKHLYEFDKLNNEFEKELEVVDKRTVNYIEHIDNQIADKKKEYESLIARIENEKKDIEDKNNSLAKFLSQASQLNKEIEGSKEKITDLRKAANDIVPEIEALEKDSMKKFMDQQTQALERISTKQAAFLKEIMLKRKFMKIGLEESQMIKEKLDIFFSKQQTLQRNYDNLKGSKCDIMNELHEILKLAEEYKVMAKNSDISKDFKKLESRFASLDTKRAEFSKELGCLRSTVSGKTRIKAVATNKTSGKKASSSKKSVKKKAVKKKVSKKKAAKKKR